MFIILFNPQGNFVWEVFLFSVPSLRIWSLKFKYLGQSSMPVKGGGSALEFSSVALMFSRANNFITGDFKAFHHTSPDTSLYDIYSKIWIHLTINKHKIKPLSLEASNINEKSHMQVKKIMNKTMLRITTLYDDMKNKSAEAKENENFRITILDLEEKTYLRAHLGYLLKHFKYLVLFHFTKTQWIDTASISQKREQSLFVVKRFVFCSRSHSWFIAEAILLCFQSLSPLLFFIFFLFSHVMIAGLFCVNILGDTTNFDVTFTGNRNILLRVYLLNILVECNV